MPSVPRIVRAVPHGPITRPEHSLPVVVRIRWHHGVEHDVLAIATAWTRDAVEVSWEAVSGEGMRSDWVPATDVRRSVEPPVNLVEPAPHTTAGRPRAR